MLYIKEKDDGWEVAICGDDPANLLTELTLISTQLLINVQQKTGLDDEATRRICHAYAEVVAASLEIAQEQGAVRPVAPKGIADKLLRRGEKLQ